MPEKPAATIGQEALFPVLEQILEDLAGDITERKRPEKEELLAYLNNSAKKMNLFFIRHLPQATVAAIRKDRSLNDRLNSTLRQLIISLHKPLLSPGRVKSLVKQASYYPMAEVRKDPDLWAARILAALPVKPDIRLSLVSLRLLMPEIKKMLEQKILQIDSLEMLDKIYGYIERELASLPDIQAFFRRALELAEALLEPGDIIAYYRLLSERIPDTLAALSPSPEKDKVLIAIKEMTGVQSPESIKLMFKKEAMAKADELMEGARSYDELFELRFFFSQIGERSNKKLLSKKAGELSRTMNIRAEGYLLLGRLKEGELDEDGLIELVPAVLGKAETFVMNAPLRFLDRLMTFYLETACPLLRRLKKEPDKVPRLIQNFKRQVGLLNIYHGINHVAEVMQRKMVLSICSPRMLAEFPDKILSYLTRLPPEFYPPAVMDVIRDMVRKKGEGYRFTTADVLCIFSAYPPVEEEEEGEGED